MNNKAVKYLYMPEHLHPEWSQDMRVWSRCEECFSQMRVPNYLLILTYDEYLINQVMTS
jgi:hypothetical protein